MKDFFGTVIEPGDAVVVAVGNCYSSAGLHLGTVVEIVADISNGHVFFELRADGENIPERDWFGFREVVSMKSIIAGKRVKQ